MKILDKFTNSEIEFILSESTSFKNFLEKIGSSYNGSASYLSIKRQLIEREIKIPNFHQKSGIRFDRKSDSEIFIVDSKFSRYHLKNRIIKNNLIEYKCLECGIGDTWNNKKISLQLEHINGINNDNRIENLCFLCPNCHSQTETYSGKNLKGKTKISEIRKSKKERKQKYCECGNKISRTSQRCGKCAMTSLRKKERPEYIQLIEDIDNLGYCGTGRKYGVSDNTIRKWKNKYEKYE